MPDTPTHFDLIVIGHQARLNDLDRGMAIQLGIVPQIDVRHPARSEETLHPVLPPEDGPHLVTTYGARSRSRRRGEHGCRIIAQFAPCWIDSAAVFELRERFRALRPAGRRRSSPGPAALSGRKSPISVERKGRRDVRQECNYRERF